MNIEELKLKIESNELDDNLIIFKNSDNSFIATQYINRIALNKKLSLNYLENLNFNSSDIFACSNSTNCIDVFITDTFSYSNNELINHSNLYIICNKIDENAANIYADYIINVPKLDSWQIKDYVYSLADGVDTNQLDNLIDICKNNIYRLDQELNKINIFDKNQRKTLFNQFIDDNIFSDLSKYTIFDFTNAIIKRDYKTLSIIYKQKENIDIEPLGVLTILYKNFKNIINVQLSPNPSPETCGLPAKQYWGVKYSCGYYTKDELIKIFSLITNVDRKIKTGELPVDILIDYLIVNILGV